MYQLTPILTKNIKTMGAITLTVQSYNNVNLTPYSGTFVISKMGHPRPNLNKTTAMTISEAGDTGSVMSSWALYGDRFHEGQVLYWSVETATDLGATVRRVRIYSNVTRTNVVSEGTATIANNNSGTVYFSQLNDSGISGSVLVTIGGSLTNDNDSGNTLTLSGVTVQTNFQLNGESEFMYTDGKERRSKVTVSETVAEIQDKINALYS